MIYFTLYPSIWQDVRLSTEQKLVANYIWQWTVKAEYSWAPNETIANTFGLDVDSVSDAIASLKSKNYINYLECPEGTCYEFNMTKYE